MATLKVVVLGGSGFVGSHLVDALSTAGHEVKVLARRREDAKPLFLLPQVEVEECDIFFEAALKRAITGSDAVINLVGILHETGVAGFSRIHSELPCRVAEACHEQGVPRLLHMSALCASLHAPSAYLRSKAAGENGLRAAAGEKVVVTIFRPSVIFGRGDSFLNLFAALLKRLPMLPLGKPHARFQPVFVEDVARAFVASLENPATFGHTYELGGPQVYSLRQLVEYVAATLGLKCRIINLNDRLAYLQAWAMEFSPVKLLTRDNFYSMQSDSVCTSPFPAVFGFQPTALEAVAPDYLAQDTPRKAYLRFRRYAGR